MVSKFSPRLRRFNVVLNSFASCISNAPEEFSRTPKMSFSEILSQPGMLLHQTERAVSFEQLQSFADAHSRRHFNKKMHMVWSHMQLIHFKSVFNSNFSKDPFKFFGLRKDCERFLGIFRFPNKVKSILPERMLSSCKIHFLSPELTQEDRAHANSISLVSRGSTEPLVSNIQKELNLVEEGNSSLGSKAEVSLPWM